jgi:hypothetical protein
MAQTVFFAFRGDPLCFIHVLLNGLDLAEQGLGGKIVMEGEAVKLVPLMEQPDHFLHQLYRKAQDRQLIIGCCRACSNKLGVAAEIEAAGLPLIGEMTGHPAMSEYITQGYHILTF